MAHTYQYDPRRYASRTTQTMDSTYSMTSRTTTTVKADCSSGVHSWASNSFMATSFSHLTQGAS